MAGSKRPAEGAQEGSEAEAPSPGANAEPPPSSGGEGGLPSCGLPPAAAAEVAALFGLREGASALLVGEGNLSFASALARLGTGCRILATTHEAAEEHGSRFAGSAAAVASLRSAGTAVAHGVDATALASTLPEGARGPFDRIIFQFPQHPERRKIHRHRELLRLFFASAVEHLGAHGEILVSLCRGQGGTAAEASEKREKDTWQVQDAAAEAGLILRAVHPCPVDHLAALGYERTGFRGHGLRGSNAEVYQERAFNSDGSLTHIFGRESAGTTAAFPLRWSHDVSFWTAEDFQEQEFHRLVTEACGPGVEPVLTLLDQYVSSEGRRARTYRIAVSVDKRAIPRSAWRHICESVRERMASAGAAPRQGAAAGQETSERERPPQAAAE